MPMAKRGDESSKAQMGDLTLQESLTEILPDLTSSSEDTSEDDTDKLKNIQNMLHALVIALADFCKQKEKHDYSKRDLSRQDPRKKYLDKKVKQRARKYRTLETDPVAGPSTARTPLLLTDTPPPPGVSVTTDELQSFVTPGGRFLRPRTGNQMQYTSNKSVLTQQSTTSLLSEPVGSLRSPESQVEAPSMYSNNDSSSGSSTGGRTSRYKSKVTARTPYVPPYNPKDDDPNWTWSCCLIGRSTSGIPKLRIKRVRVSSLKRLSKKKMTPRTKKEKGKGKPSTSGVKKSGGRLSLSSDSF